MPHCDKKPAAGILPRRATNSQKGSFRIGPDLTSRRTNDPTPIQPGSGMSPVTVAVTMTVTVTTLPMLGMMRSVSLRLVGDGFIGVLIAVPVQPPLHPEKERRGQGGSNDTNDEELRFRNQEPEQGNQ